MTKTFSQPTIVSMAIVVTLFTVCLIDARAEDSAAKGSQFKDSAANAADCEVAGALVKANENLAPDYTLAYKCAPGEDARTKVVHLLTVETKLKGSPQTARTRSVS